MITWLPFHQNNLMFLSIITYCTCVFIITAISIHSLWSLLNQYLGSFLGFRGGGGIFLIQGQSKECCVLSNFLLTCSVSYRVMLTISSCQSSQYQEENLYQRLSNICLIFWICKLLNSLRMTQMYYIHGRQTGWCSCRSPPSFVASSDDMRT